MSQQVTGMTAFWAVLALALNAMARPSFASKALFDQENSFESSFIPELSSPMICVVDCLMELVVLGRVLYKACFKQRPETLPGHESSATTHKARYDSVAVRMLLFILGGLPQAIKMSGMRGIPITQTLSAVFLTSTVLATLSELLSERAETEKKAVSAWLRKNHRKMDVARALIFLSHGIMAAIAWNMVSKNLVLHKDTPGIVVADLGLWIGAIATLLATLLTIVWVLGTFLAPMTFVRRLRIRVSPMLACIPFMLLFSYPRKLVEAGEKARNGCQGCNETTLINVVWSIAPLITIAASGSYVVAAGLVRVTNILIRANVDEHQSPQEDEPQNQSSDQSSQRPNSGAIATTQNDSQDDSEVDPVEDLLKTGSITLLLPLHKHLDKAEEKDDQVSAAELSQQSATADETAHHQPPQQVPHPPTANAPPSSPTTSSTTKPERDTIASRLRISGTHWNWILVGYSFWNFRSKIPAALRYQWTSTAGPIRKKVYMCLGLSWDIFKLFALQSIWFAIFMVASIFDFTPVDRLFARIARKVDPGTGRFWFPIFNLVTVFSVYAVAFDGSGTVNPGWTGVLGRKS